ncbi:MAG: DUF924 domain-containing protein [Gammaproteobacteria bacterium]
MTETIDSVLEFWFGRGTTAAEVAAEKTQLWWSKNAGIDREITARFAAGVSAIAVSATATDAAATDATATDAATTDAAAGAFAGWSDSPRGHLALIIYTDQFPRNMHRDSAAAFAHDPLALRFAKQCDSARLRPIERVFAYLPFEHSEVPEEQERSVALYCELAARAAPSERELFDNYVTFARKHHDIIKRFGRFPHRNKALGRESTSQEVAFLREPGSSF